MTISLVQQGNGFGAAAFGSNITPGNAVIITSGALSSPTFSATDTFTVSSSTGELAWICYNLSSAGGYTTITATNDTAAAIWIYEVSGVSGVGTGHTNGGVLGSTWNSGSITTASAVEFIVGVTGCADSSGVFTITGPTAPWFNETGRSWTFVDPTIGISGYQVTSSSGTYAYSGSVFTESGNPNCFSSVLSFTSTPPLVTFNLPQFRVNTAIYPIISSAARNLIMSVASMEGVDPYNNFYPEGVGVEGNIGLINLSPTKNLLAVYGNLHT